jgi:hypothetical protein
MELHMAGKKKDTGIIESLEDGVLNLADAVSVAATGSQLGILERAAEDELKDASRVQPGRKKKKKKAAKKPSKTAVRQKVIDARRAKRSGKKLPIAKKKKAKRAKR